MKKMFSNMAPYWKSIIIIVLLLIVQAWCDLALPQYTSDIIDVGIQNSGVEHILPEKMTEAEYEAVQLFMTDDEAEQFEACYTQEDEGYTLNISSNSELEELDAQLLYPVIISYQMSRVSEEEFKDSMAQQSGMDPSVIQNMTLDDIQTNMGINLNTVTSTETTDGVETQVTYVDMRSLFSSYITMGMMTKEDLLTMRESMESSFETLGTSMIKSMGVQYAIRCNQEAGVNTDKLQTGYLWEEGLKMLSIALIMGIVTILVSFVASKVGAAIGRDLRQETFRKVVGFSNAEMDKFSTASLITRSTNDIQQIQMVSIMLLRMIAYAPILGIGGVIKVVNTGAGMGWIIGLAILVILGFVGVLMAITMPKFQLMQKLVDRVNLVSREILTGLSVIRAFGREREEEKRFDQANTDLTKTMLFTNRVMNFMMPGMMLIMNGLSILIVWVAAHKIDAGSLQVGAMTAFITYAMMIVMSFFMLTMMSIMLPRAAVAANRIEEVMRTNATIIDPANPERLNAHTGTLVFNHVNFRYPGAEEDALSDIDFKTEPGKTTAIIGSTGCGKSTLVNLIPRLYDVTSGSITMDGMDIRNISMEELRGEIGFVPQKGVLFSGTIASNLRFGRKEATDEEIAAAAEIAQVTEFITEKKEGYDSHIAQGGTNVSGGQKQRLSIARAIAKNPKLFVFDDSFSALDLKTDAILRKALTSKVKDAAVIIVAQRVSTILHAEQILVLDDGKIVGKGTHEELLNNCDVYRQIAMSQLSAKELGIEEEA